MDFYRKIERSVTISADKRSTVDLQVDIWSQDLNVTKFVLKLDTADSTPIDLTNAAVRVAIVYNQDGQDVKIEAAGIVEDVATQKIAYVMSDKLAGFEGEVTAGFYVTLKTGQRIDIQNVTFNMCKSLLDKDLEAATENYYQTFDDIAKDVRNQADTQKSAMLAKTNEVKSYGDAQKTAMNNIVKDVQSTGNTAKTQIGQVLPDVQSKVNAINTELAKIGENMPDLFVAYADDANGGGFSKTDSSKLYKGYGVKNSTNPTDYRWERNINIIATGQNLIRNTNTDKMDISWSMQTGGFIRSYYADNGLIVTKLKRDNVAQTGWSVINIKGIVLDKIKPNTRYTIDIEIMTTSSNRLNFDIRNGSGLDNITDKYNMNYNMKANQWNRITFNLTTLNNMPELTEQLIYVTGMDSSAGSEYHFKNISMKELNSNWSPSPEDITLNSNPINSILTTLSAENPSTTLGGTWTQLGTESKFGSTIYYWKRTN